MKEEGQVSTRVVAVVGSYQRGGATDLAVEAILGGARAKGAITRTFRLTEQHLEFCKNCRACTLSPGEERCRCAQEDDLEMILRAIEAADAVVLASPVNYYNVTAIFRRFLERLIGFAYWPWKQNGPVLRSKLQPRKAVLVATAGMPGFLIPVTTGAARALRLTARMLGAKPIGKLWIGLMASEPQPTLPARTAERARRLGMKLA
jgi:putative NADPH-quinone reductase